VKRAVAALLTVTLAGGALGCAGNSAYVPRVVARGEITLRYGDGFEAWAGGQRVSHGLRWRGLPSYVSCVPAARENADEAARAGDRALGFSIVGGILGGLGAGGIIGVVDEANRWAWLGAGLGTAVVGAVFAGAGRLYRNRANGHAVDAINQYNDAVGSLGATCADLTYPPPAGPAPPAPATPAPSAPVPAPATGLPSVPGDDPNRE
jgi:hypothetical protein